MDMIKDVSTYPLQEFSNFSSAHSQQIAPPLSRKSEHVGAHARDVELHKSLHSIEAPPEPCPITTRVVSHLPTPQSPNNFSPYVGGSTDSPIQQHDAPSSSSSVPRRQIDPGSSQQMLTPDSSPLVNRWALPGQQTTPTRRRPSPPRTPPPTNQHSAVPQVPFTTADVARVTPPPLSTTLSSPFSPQSFGQPQPLPGSSNNPVHSPTHTDPEEEETPLLGGGELERIRAARARMQQETEARRPEYLQRVLGAGVGAGIAESPVKGRRIELFGFTETSEESFEERLMAGGYVGYGSTGGATEPSSMPSKSLDELLATPVKPKQEEPDDINEKLDERARRKRRRLAAFKRAELKKSRAALHAVELDGVGRVLIDLAPEREPEPKPDDTPKRRGGRRRKRPGRGGRPAHAGENAGLHWPDEQFPWSVRTDERRSHDHMNELENLKWVDRYLDSDGDSTDEEEVIPKLDVPPMELDPLPTPYSKPGPGRGKSIPQKEAVRRRVFVPSDPADARAALLSKRVVRDLITARRAGTMSVCICGAGDDGREQVQCDDCSRWYHLECLGIGSADELGDEDDEWFCYACVDDGRGRAAPGARDLEPTFVRSDENTPGPSYSSRDPLFYDGIPSSGWRTPEPSSPPSSPSVWHTPSIHPPTTPTPRVRREPSTRSTIGEPRTPSSSVHAPRIRVAAFGTPDGVLEPFDPSSTPSRGIRAKEGSGNWAAARYGGPLTANMFATPTQPRRERDILPRYARFSGHYVPTSAGPVGGMGYEDTPVDRSVSRVPLRSFKTPGESPLVGRERDRPPPRFVFDTEGSPSFRIL